MPRLSNQLYYDRHRFLKQAWHEFRELYTLLPVDKQWAVHDYYQPTKDLNQSELLHHRQVITKQRPVLAAKANKSYTVMYRAFRVAFEYAEGDESRFRQALDQFAQPRSYVTHTYAVGNRQRTSRITATAKPELDAKRYARALLALVEQLGEERCRGFTSSRSKKATTT